uniref:GAG-pre-integrase domain-containing protein n=1 Tax=Tanacetum cinerariifolium TaxID=118510 RepID=A0A6L2M0B9_TANCI|nr:hypothetical protein [Tanacetum cinerariifolium]
MANKGTIDVPVTIPRLSGKVALITGGARGIGESIARLFTKHGAKVVTSDILDDLGQTVVENIGLEKASYIHCDVCIESDVEKAINYTIDKHGKLDIMVNNAAVAGDLKFSILENNVSDFERVLSINVTGLTKNVAAELGEFGIRVNCVSPHFLLTPATMPIVKKYPHLYTNVYSNLKGIELKEQDVAEATLFLASDESKIKRYIDTKPNHELIHYCLLNPSYEYKWTEKAVPVAEGSSETTTERYMEYYKNVSQDIHDQMNAKVESVQIILTGIDNDIYSTVDAYPNACEMWKAIERLKEGESINVRDLETNLYWEFGKFTSHDGESLESYYSKFYKMMNELVRNQWQADWKDDTDDEYGDQELEAHYMYMAQIQEITPDIADNFGPIFDTEPLQKDDTDELAQERDLLASLIEKLKCKIDDSGNFCAKAKGDLMSYTMESENSFNEYTRKINDLNQTISDMKKELFAHQETISILSQKKEAQIKYYKTCEDKEIDKVIALENKVKVLDNIVYKTSQSVQIINMLNHNCKTSFAKLEFLKKAQRTNPRLYDIGYYNDNLVLMLAPESDEVIRLEKESRSKLSDLIRPFDYDQLINLCHLFVSQLEKSSTQRYFSKTSKISHTHVNNENSKESFNKLTTLLEKRMDESIPWDQKCKSSKELFKIKKSVDTIFDGVERCKQTIAKRTYFGHIDPFIQNTIEGNFFPQIRRINANLEKFHLCLKEKMVTDLRYFNYLEHEVDSLKSQLDTQKTQFLNEIDRLLREYYYADLMNAILGVYTEMDEVNNLQCDYLKALQKCGCLKKELSKRKTMSKRFEALQKHAINLELELQQCKETMKNDKSSVIRQPNAFKSQRPSILGKPDIFSDSLEKKNCSKSKTKQPIVVSISIREPKQIVNQYVETSFKKTIATNSIVKKPKNITRKLYEHVSKISSWWYPKFTPSGYKWKPKSPTRNVKTNVSMPLRNASRDANILEPMTPRCFTMSNTPLSFNSFAARRDYPIHRRLWVLKTHDEKSQVSINFVEKFLGTMKFENDQIALILGYGDLVHGPITIKRVYYVEGLNHNLFFVGQFCDVDLEVAFQKSTCYIRDLKGNDLLTGSRGTYMYSVTLQDTSSPNLIYLTTKATSSQAWLWHHHLSHLNFDTINLLSKYNIVTGLPNYNSPKIIFGLLMSWGKLRESLFTLRLPQD